MAASDDTPDQGTFNPLIGEAKDWANGRQAKTLCLELYCRLVEVTLALHRISSMHGVDLDGNYTTPSVRHPAPPPAQLKEWMEDLRKWLQENPDAPTA